MAKTDSNPLVARLRDRQGLMGIFHRSNSALIALALMVHVAVGFALWRMEWESIWVVFVGFHTVAFFVITLSSIGGVNFQVRSARSGGGWDELLITQLSDRELVNGMLFTALRPGYQFALLVSPSVAALVLTSTRFIITVDGLGSGIVVLVGLSAFLILAYVMMGVFIIGLSVLALHHSLRHEMGGHVVGIGIFLIGLLAPALFFISLPLFFIVVAWFWYRYRLLCCTFRQQLLRE